MNYEWNKIQATLESKDAEKIKEVFDETLQKTLCALRYMCRRYGLGVDCLIASTMSGLLRLKDDKSPLITDFKKEITVKVAETVNAHIFYDPKKIREWDVIAYKEKDRTYRVNGINGDQMSVTDLLNYNIYEFKLDKKGFLVGVRISDTDRAKLTEHFFFFD